MYLPLSVADCVQYFIDVVLWTYVRLCDAVTRNPAKYVVMWRMLYLLS